MVPEADQDVVDPPSPFQRQVPSATMLGLWLTNSSGPKGGGAWTSAPGGNPAGRGVTCRSTSWTSAGGQRLAVETPEPSASGRVWWATWVRTRIR